MPYIYGNDFSSLQSGINADAALRQHGLESALAGAVGALSQMSQRQQLDRQFRQNLAAHADQLEAEKEHWKQQADQADKALAAGADLRAAEAAHLRSLTDKMPPEKVRSLALQTNLASQAAQLGEFDASKYPDLPQDFVASLQSVHEAADARNTQDYQRAHGLAFALNTKSDLQDKIAAATRENAALGTAHWWSDPQKKARVEQNTKNIAQWTAELSQHARALKPFEDSKYLDRYVQPSLTTPGTFEPAIPTPFSLRRRGQAPADLSPEEQDAMTAQEQAAARQAAPVTTKTATTTAPARAPAATAPTTATAAATTPPTLKYPPEVYLRTKALRAQGVDPSIALGRALAEYQAAQQPPVVPPGMMPSATGGPPIALPSGY